MPNRFSGIAAGAAGKTRAQLDEELAQVTPLTADQLSGMLPRKVDKQLFLELMDIVDGSTSRNSKIASLRSDIGRFGEIIIRVLETVL